MIMEEIHCKVTGRVQMVMFRDFVQRKARSMRLSGFVRNLNDGSVEVVAQGSREELEKLTEYLHEGSWLSKVDEVNVEWRKPQETFVGFSILY